MEFDGSDGCITIPFLTNRAARGAIVISPTMSKRDPLDLPPNQLKKLVQGHLWRDQHFSGQAIRQIAENEGRSESYIGNCIFDTFAII